MRNFLAFAAHIFPWNTFQLKEGCCFDFALLIFPDPLRLVAVLHRFQPCGLCRFYSSLLWRRAASFFLWPYVSLRKTPPLLHAGFHAVHFFGHRLLVDSLHHGAFLPLVDSSRFYSCLIAVWPFSSSSCGPAFVGLSHLWV